MDKFDTIKNMAYDLIIMTLKSNAPKDTGNLSQNAIVRIENYIRIGGEIAPYAQKTEEENKSSKGWIKNTIEMLIPTIEGYFKNQMSNEDIQEMINDQETSFDKQFEHMAQQKEKGVR